MRDERCVPPDTTSRMCRHHDTGAALSAGSLVGSTSGRRAHLDSTRHPSVPAPIQSIIGPSLKVSQIKVAQRKCVWGQGRGAIIRTRRDGL